MPRQGVLREAIEQAGDAVIITDTTGTIEYVNAAFERLTGYARSEAIGRNPRLLKSGRQDARFYESMWTTLRCGEAWRGRLCNRRKDGTLYVAECQTTPVATGGAGVTHFVQIQRDVTREVELEDALHRSEQRFRALLEDGPDAMILSDEAGTILFANAACRRCFGYEPTELIGRSIEVLVPPQHRERHRDRCSRLFAERFRDGSVRHASLDLFALRNTGEEFPIEINLSPIVTSDGITVLSSIRDLTERRRLEQQLRHAQKMEAVGRLAGGIAHDFNNLLSVILTYSALAKAGLPPANPVREQLEEIARAGERAATLTRQLLAFSRQQVLVPAVMRLNEPVAGMAEMLRRLIGEDIELLVHLDEALGNVRADASQLEQVVVNLAVNARDAMPRGGTLTIETRNVELDELEPKAYAVLAVSDTGTGMDDATVTRLFEPFFTTKERGRGTGLGLSTTHGIVEQSGGHIRVHTELGRGSMFEVWLPCVPDDAVPRARRPSAGTSPRGSETILLVEDEDQVRRVARQILARNGYRVIEARSADDALATIDAHAAIDLLLTDVVMPGMSGPQLAAKLVARLPALRVLYMSGYTANAIADYGALEQGIGFVQKPFTPPSLAAKVREVLDGRSPAD